MLKILSYYTNDKKVLSPNLKAIAKSNTEIHVLKVKNKMLVYEPLLQPCHISCGISHQYIIM